MTFYHSINITKPTPFRRWGVSCSRLENAPGVCLHLCFYLKILLLVQFLSYMLYICFADLFVLMVYIFISYIFLLMWLLLFILCVYCYSNNSFSWLYCSFNIIFWSSDYCFLLNSDYYTRSIYYFSSSISMLNYKYLCKIYHGSFTTLCTCFSIYSLNITSDHRIYLYLFFDLFTESHFLIIKI